MFVVPEPLGQVTEQGFIVCVPHVSGVTII